jgi:TPR repeat protein
MLKHLVFCSVVFIAPSLAFAADTCTTRLQQQAGQQQEETLFDQGASAFAAGDYATALASWEPLARKGNCNAQFNLGTLYLKGRGVAADASAAVGWFRKAAEQGQAMAQFNMGEAYRTGTAVDKDQDQAVRWYTLAADQGLAVAQHFLGVAYATGQGAPQDFGAAMHNYRKAAEQGHPDAQYNLGLMYAFARGVPQDKVLAYFFVKTAAAQGSRLAVKGVPVVAAKMTAYQLAEADKMIDAWTPGMPFPVSSVTGQR